MTPPPINIDGTGITGATIDGTDVSEVTVDGTQVFSPLPDSEGFEHNDLARFYSGDTSAFEIQSTSFEGAFALRSTNNDQSNVITRSTTQKFNRNGLRIDFKYLFESQNPAAGGIAINEADTGYASSNGYRFYASRENQEILIVQIPTGNLLAVDSVTLPSNTWIDGFIEFSQNGDMTFSLNATTITANNTDHTDVYLAFYQFDAGWHVDDVEFSLI